MDKRIGIYEILNLVDNKFYIGSSIRMGTRFASHRRELRRGEHSNLILQRAWDKYGEAWFQFKPILTCAKSMLLFYEQQLIDKAKPEYNIAVAAGAPMRGRKHTAEFCTAARARRHTPEARARISAAQMGRANPSAHIAHEFNRGKARSAETRARISANRKGKRVGFTQSAETRAKISAARKGKPLSAEHCAKLSASHKGMTLPAESRAKLSASLKGVKRTPEYCAAISARQMGVPKSQEQKDKISATLIARNAQRRSAQQADGHQL